MDILSDSVGRHVKTRYYRTLELATGKRRDFEQLREQLVSILYDVVDIDLFQDVAEEVVESIDELTEGVKGITLLHRYGTLLDPSTCSIHSFRPLCRELLELVNRVLSVTRGNKGQRRMARMHTMGIQIIK
ncbi:hypothetical protein MSL71_42090 [Desulfoluna butyratoxydans]|uniref:Uncharacterized protein n=1 Tax=Desulfoluna butyratoxydans TaxID=231438 RepID=A0A4U8YWZ9_9BACT|nr:hypothetical protein MSL71_42090 [Desulfoluna butyratoxydans]